MNRNFYNYDVAPGKGAEAEKFLKDRALRLKDNPGFLGCCILKDNGEHAGGNDYAFIHDWRSPQDLHAFMEKNATTVREFFAAPKLDDSTSHEHEHEHEHPHEHKAEAKKGAIQLEFHGHYEVIFQL